MPDELDAKGGFIGRNPNQPEFAQVSPTLFPGGAKLEWWSKAIQLDLEARLALVGTRWASAVRPNSSPSGHKKTGPEGPVFIPGKET
jgi:hypothetical protein